MDGRGVAWLSYLPVPGLGVLAVALARSDRLVRYHAWQATVLVLGGYLLLILVGLLGLASDAKAFRAIVGFVAGVLLLAVLVQLAWGGTSAAMGRYARLRPAWDVAALLRRG